MKFNEVDMNWNYVINIFLSCFLPVWMYVLINNECERGVRLVDWRALALYGLVATYLFIYITDDLPAVFQVSNENIGFAQCILD